MDPLSIIASSIAIVTICSQVTAILSKWIYGVQNVETTLGYLAREVAALSTTLKSISTIFQRSALIAIIEDESEAWLLSSIGGILKGCKLTMRRLRRIISDLDNTIGTGSIFRKILLHIRLGSKMDDVAALLRQIQACSGLLQMNMQCVSMWVLSF
jgi:hypothetical protein